MRRGISFTEWFMNTDVLTMDIMFDWGIPVLTRIIKPKPFDDVPMEATVSNVKVEVIKVQVWRMITLNRLYLK